jgi:hypothetical protein
VLDQAQPAVKGTSCSLVAPCQDAKAAITRLVSAAFNAEFAPTCRGLGHHDPAGGIDGGFHGVEIAMKMA